MRKMKLSWLNKFKDMQLISSKTRIQTWACLKYKLIRITPPFWAFMESNLGNKGTWWNAGLSLPGTKPPEVRNSLTGSPYFHQLTFSCLWSSARAKYNVFSKMLGSQFLFFILSLIPHLLSFIKQIITTHIATWICPLKRIKNAINGMPIRYSTAR